METGVDGPSAAGPSAAGPSASPPSPQGSRPPDKEKPRRGGLPPQTIEKLLAGLPDVAVEVQDGLLVLHGWTRDESERAALERVIKLSALEVLDLTTEDIGERDKMVEVDVIIAKVRDIETESLGFNFLELVNINFDYYYTDSNAFPGIGFTGPGTIGDLVSDDQTSWIFNASVDYDVNIANSTDDKVAIMARPVLTTLNGEVAELLVGSEVYFKVSGLNTGSVTPYEFGIKLQVLPTILKSKGSDQRQRVLMDVVAERSSLASALVDEVLFDPADLVVDKTKVSSKTVLPINETLVLSGLYQRERIKRRSGVPILMNIPIISLFTSRIQELDGIQSTVILMTPRTASVINEERLQSLEDFIQLRRDLLEAAEKGPEAMEEFKRKHPDWYLPQPSRNLVHFALLRHSEIYRNLSGNDLSQMPLEDGLWKDDKRPLWQKKYSRR